MKTTLVMAVLLTESRVRHGLALAVFGWLVAVILLAWSFKLSRPARNLPVILFTGIVPLFLLSLMWPQLRLAIFASLAALLVLSCFSKRSRRVLRLPMMLFAGLIPLFLLIGVDDTSWSAALLLVYLGLINLEPKNPDNNHADSEDEMLPGPAARIRHFVYCVSVGFLWILLFAALLWYVAEPVTWREV